MATFNRCLGLLATALELLAVVMMALMGGFVMLSAVMRYAFAAPFAFTEEIVGLLFCAVVFLTLPAIQRDGQHIRINLFDTAFGRKLGQFQSLARSVVSLIFYGWFLVTSINYLSYTFRAGSQTAIGSIPIFPWVAMISLALFICILIVIIDLITKKRNGKS